MNTARFTRLWLLAALLLLAGFSPTRHVYAHGIRPALLNIIEREPGWFDVTFKVPMRSGTLLDLKPELPPNLVLLDTPSSHNVPGATVQYSTYQNEGGSLAGETITIDGLTATLTDALLRIKLIDGGTHSALLSPSSPSFTIPRLEPQSPWEIIAQNMGRSLKHLSGGVNHSMLVLAVVLLAGGTGAFKLLIAFLLGHAASLVLADLGIMGFPPLIGEVLCMVVILLAARGIVSGCRDPLAFAAPFFLAGVFHGLGNTRILAEAGIPQSSLVQALFAFNLGLDLEQIAMVAVITLVVMAARRLRGFEKTRTVAAYAVGIAAVVIGIGMFMEAIGSDWGVSKSEASRPQPVISPLSVPAPLTGNRSRPLPQLQDPVETFLTIEPYEVRLEVLLQVKELNRLNRLTPIEGQMVEPDAQEPLIQELLALIGERSGVVIDGKERVPALKRGEFVMRGSYGILTRKQKIPESVSEALIGVTFVYGIDQLPREVILNWDLFFPPAGEVTVTSTDPFEGKQSVLTTSSSSLRWENRYAQFKVPVIKPIPVSPLRVPVLSVVLLLAFIMVVVIGARRGRSLILRGVGTTCIALAIVAYPFVRTPFELTGSRAFTPTGEEAGNILQGLLVNVYRSFDIRDEETVYDRLALTISGDQLTDIYLESRRALEMEDRGGARGKADDVSVEDVRGVTKQADGSFAVDADWTVSGSVTHFGHTHYRRNRYHAIVSIFPDGDVWKIGGISLIDERRLL